jgi:sec-independent protein translocase protein TatB
MMANIGMADTLILMVLALVVFGPRRLPQIGRQIGKLMYEFRKASNDFKFQMEEELRQAEEADRRKKEEEERKRVLAAAPPPPQIEQSTTPVAESPIAPAESVTPSSSLAESPYANLTYPEGAGESRDETSAELTTAQTPADPSPAAASEPPPPRILPPSTGEKIAADRPGAQPDQPKLVGSNTGKAPDSVAPEAERSEPAAAHHAANNATHNG